MKDSVKKKMAHPHDLLAQNVPADPGITFLRDAAVGCEVVLATGDSVAYPVHCHMENFVVGLVRSGRVRLVRERRSDSLAAGGVFAVPPHQAHSLSATGPYAVVSLCLDATKLRASSVRFAGRVLGRLGRLGVLSREECAALTAALARFPAPGRPAARRAADPFDVLRRGIATDPARYSSLTDMAGEVHVCPRHFVRTFRLRYGLPPLRYQRQSRLRRARMELAAGTRSLAQTACGAGFFDQSHFIREFKKLYRMTPGEYQRARFDLPVS